MAHNKPFHRNVREMIDGPNAGYSGWAYIPDPLYAKVPTHYVRAYSIIQKDLESLFEYIEPSPESLKAYSYRIHELLMRTCIEIEANFKSIMSENIFTPQIIRGNDVWNMGVYHKVNKTHRLSSYEVSLPIWSGPKRIFAPYLTWSVGTASPDWYKAYNASKHDRQTSFKEANLDNLLNAVAGLLILLSSQFKNHDFSAGATLLSISGDEYHDMEPSIGSLFRIKYPDDWQDSEKYDFDWSVLKQQPDRFQKFDYNNI